MSIESMINRAMVMEYQGLSTRRRRWEKNFSGAAGDEVIAIWVITNNKLPDVAKLKAKEKKRMLIRGVLRVKVPKKKHIDYRC
jgi:hypothetical protein